MSSAPGSPDPIDDLRFLYVGVDDTGAAVDLYRAAFGARLRWRFQRFGADVAGLEVGHGPLVLLADHRPTGSVLPIWAVDDLAAVQDRAQAAGAVVAGPEGTPEGDVVVVSAPGHEVAFLAVVRPGALDEAFDDDDNPSRVR